MFIQKIRPLNMHKDVDIHYRKIKIIRPLKEVIGDTLPR